MGSWTSSWLHIDFLIRWSPKYHVQKEQMHWCELSCVRITFHSVHCFWKLGAWMVMGKWVKEWKTSSHLHLTNTRNQSKVGSKLPPCSFSCVMLISMALNMSRYWGLNISRSLNTANFLEDAVLGHFPHHIQMKEILKVMKQLISYSRLRERKILDHPSHPAVWYLSVFICFWVVCGLLGPTGVNNWGQQKF